MLKEGTSKQKSSHDDMAADIALDRRQGRGARKKKKKKRHIFPQAQGGKRKYRYAPDKEEKQGLRGAGERNQKQGRLVRGVAKAPKRKKAENSARR